MIISHKYKIVFIHIPKAMGTFITNILYKLDNNIEYYNIDNNGHVKLIDIINNNKYEDIKDYIFFCVIRNPIDLFISLYNYILTNNNHYLHKDIKKYGYYYYLVNYFKFNESSKSYIDNDINKKIYIIRYDYYINDLISFFKYCNIDITNIKYLLNKKINESIQYIKNDVDNYDDFLKIFKNNNILINDSLFYLMINNDENYNNYINTNFIKNKEESIKE